MVQVQSRERRGSMKRWVLSRSKSSHEIEAVEPGRHGNAQLEVKRRCERSTGCSGVSVGKPSLLDCDLDAALAESLDGLDL
jgi:hypothetical protein